MQDIDLLKNEVWQLVRRFNLQIPEEPPMIEPTTTQLETDHQTI